MREGNYEVKEADWEKIDSHNYGEIKFRKKRNNIKRFLKLVIFILIATLSGTISSSYIIEKKYSEIVKVNNEKVDTQYKETKGAGKEDAYSNITRVAEIVGPTVVGIMIKPQGSSHNNTGINSSGVIFNPNGYIVTNCHIIKEKDEINVKLPNGQNYLKAKLIGADPLSDLAVIKIEAKNLPVATFGDSSKMRVGDIAVAIGNPLGEESVGNVTSGIISAKNKKVQFEKGVYKVFQTDATINHENSGGVLCNEEGEVIGINSLTLKDKKFKTTENIGVAICINEVKSILNQIMKNGKVVISEGNDVKGLYEKEGVKKN